MRIRVPLFVGFPQVSTCLRSFNCKSLERIKGQQAEEVFGGVRIVNESLRRSVSG